MNFKLIRLRRTLFGLAAFILNHLPLLFLTLFLVFLVWLGFQANSLISAAGVKTETLTTFFKNPQTVLAHTNDRTNFLILGIRGFGDQGEDLTDTMLIVSYHYPTNKTSLISLPRDLWVNSLKTKINAVYHYGKFRSPDGGIKLTQAAILETMGLPIHYTAVLDFNLFKDVINLIGGVDLTVVRSFTDTQFPLPGKEKEVLVSARYETISFPAGPTHFDGETALKFVRSRNAEGEEGTDTARNARQQLVFTAIRQKLLTPKILLDRQKVTDLFHLITQNTDTNLSPDLYPSLARLALSAREEASLNEIELSYKPDVQGITILENPPAAYYQGQWVLIAKDGNWQALSRYLQNRLDGKQ